MQLGLKLAFQQTAGSRAEPADSLDARLSGTFNLREHAQETRPHVEHFIRQCFHSSHQAHVRQFMPRLFSLRTPQDDLIAAFGLRHAADSPLFLEQYLDCPIDLALSAHAGAAVSRHEVVEVGNLSASYPGAARWLIVALTALLHQEGFKWVVFTGTAELRNGFHRLGLYPVELGAARLEHLPEAERGGWGQYYAHAPKVMAGDIAQGFSTLLQHQNFSGLLRGLLKQVNSGIEA